MWALITKPFAWLMRSLYTWTGNYGLSIILFALAVNLILTPFMAKSKKGMMRTSRLQPQIQELQRRHEGNPQKLNQEMQKLYKENGTSPMSGCIWSLIPFPILIALYSVIRQPLSRMMFVSQDVIDKLQNFLVTNGLYEIPAKTDAYFEIKLTDLAHQNWSILPKELTEQLMDIDFSFLGLNLGQRPQWNFFLDQDIMSDSKKWLPALGLFLIPFLSAFLSWVSMKVSNSANPQNDAATQSSMKTMNLMMPLMSVWFCFIMPAAMGIYWIANSVFGMVRDYILTKVYKKQLDEEDAVRIAAKSEREREIEMKHLETERLKAEGKTEKNTNTSKKKIQANEKAKSDERKAELDRADRAARRERLGIKENEIPASQVGNRRYARGRAYVPDRFTNPENAEAATIAAAEQSESAEPIDESVTAAEETAVETVETSEKVETVEAAETAEVVKSEEVVKADEEKQE